MPASNQKQKVHLSQEQRAELEDISRRQNVGAAKVRRARILLLADEDHPDGRRPDWHIAEVVGLCERQVSRIRQQFINEGMSLTDRKPRTASDKPPKIDGVAEAKLVTLCCSTPPHGRQRWTLQLLVDELCRLKVVTNVCRETVRKCLKKIGSSLGKANGSVSRRKIGRGLSLRWKRSSTSTKPNMMRHTR